MRSDVSAARLDGVQAVARHHDVSLQASDHIADQVFSSRLRRVHHGFEFPERRVEERRQVLGADVELGFDLRDTPDESRANCLGLAAIDGLRAVLPCVENRPKAGSS